jgi:sugar-phosphatase
MSATNLLLSGLLLQWSVPRFRAVIFDMDGLLIDTEPIWRRAEIEVFGRVGLRISEEQALETMGVRIAEIVDSYYRQHPWPGPSPEDVTDAIYDEVIRHVEEDGEANPGVYSAFETVRRAGFPIAIASSSSERLIDAVLHKLGLHDDVQVICSADQEQEGKPHPAVYLTAAKRLGVPPESCLALEDSPNGVLSSKAAGMFCIAVPDPYLAADPRMNRADVRLDSLAELTPDFLQTLEEMETSRI